MGSLPPILKLGTQPMFDLFDIRGKSFFQFIHSFFGHGIYGKVPVVEGDF